MKDVLTQVFVEKRDKLSREVLANCEIAIIDSETEEIIAQITSNEERVPINLIAGRMYRLHEVKAPEGYALAQEDVMFTAADGMTATIYDEPIELVTGSETPLDNDGTLGSGPDEPQTDDASPLAVILALLVTSFAGMVFFIVHLVRLTRTTTSAALTTGGGKPVRVKW
jgi:hypothetical protein